jgi:hypothetical protein
MRAAAFFWVTSGSELFGHDAKPAAVLKHWIAWVISMPKMDRSSVIRNGALYSRFSGR